ncbi:autophagy- protein 2, partial [Rhizophlyctis rosea]
MSSSLWPFSTRLIPQSLQKRLMKFLLKRAIGQFLATELDLANLDVELGEGRVVLKDLELNIDLLNDLAVDLPFVITDGRISAITATVPWKDIWSGNCTLELDEIFIEITPIPEDPNHGLSKSMADSDAHIMSSSIHLAENFLKQEISGEDPDNLFRPSFQPRKPPPGSSPRASSSGRSALSSSPWSNPDPGLDGLQALTSLIDKIMAKVNVVARNVDIRLVHAEVGKEYHLNLAVPWVSYSDDTPELENDSPEAGIPEEIVKVVRFERVKVRLGLVDPTYSDVTSERGDEFQGVEVEGMGEEVSRPRSPAWKRVRYLWSESIAEACDENFVRLMIDRKEGSGSVNVDMTRSELSAPADWDIHVFVKSLCALMTPDKYSILLDLVSAFDPAPPQNNVTSSMYHDAYGTDSEASAFDERVPRDRSGVGAFRRAAGLPIDSDDDSEIFDSGMVGGWPGARKSIRHEESNTQPQPPAQNIQPPTSVRLRFEIEKTSLYIALSDPSQSVRFQISTFFHMFFNDGKGASSVPATAFPTDMTASFVTNANTSFNAGVGGTVEDLMGDILGVGHFRVAVEEVLVSYGMDSRASPAVGVEVGGVEVLEWGGKGEQGAKTSVLVGYEPVLVLGWDLDSALVRQMYEQLGKKGRSPPQAKRFAA